MLPRSVRSLGDTSRGGGREKVEKQTVTSAIFLLRLFWSLVYDEPFSSWDERGDRIISNFAKSDGAISDFPPSRPPAVRSHRLPPWCRRTDAGIWKFICSSRATSPNVTHRAMKLAFLSRRGIDRRRPTGDGQSLVVRDRPPVCFRAPWWRVRRGEEKQS